MQLIRVVWKVRFTFLSAASFAACRTISPALPVMSGRSRRTLRPYIWSKNVRASGDRRKWRLPRNCFTPSAQSRHSRISRTSCDTSVFSIDVQGQRGYRRSSVRLTEPCPGPCVPALRGGEPGIGCIRGDAALDQIAKLLCVLLARSAFWGNRIGIRVLCQCDQASTASMAGSATR